MAETRQCCACLRRKRGRSVRHVPLRRRGGRRGRRPRAEARPAGGEERRILCVSYAGCVATATRHTQADSFHRRPSEDMWGIDEEADQPRRPTDRPKPACGVTTHSGRQENLTQALHTCMVAPLVAALSALGRAAALYAAADALRWTPAAANFAAVALIVAAIPSHLLAHHGGGGGGSRRQPAMGTVAAARELRNAVWLRGGVFAAGLYAFCCALRRCHNPLRAVILDGTISHVFAPWFAAAPHIHEGGGGGGGSARGAF